MDLQDLMHQYKDLRCPFCDKMGRGFALLQLYQQFLPWPQTNAYIRSIRTHMLAYAFPFINQSGAGRLVHLAIFVFAPM